MRRASPVVSSEIPRPLSRCERLAIFIVFESLFREVVHEVGRRVQVTID